MVVPGFFSRRLLAGTACVKNHLNLKSDPADRCPVLRNPYGSDVLSQLTVFRNIKPEGRRLRLTGPKERFVVPLFCEESGASGIECNCIHVYCSTFEVMLNSVLQSYS